MDNGKYFSYLQRCGGGSDRQIAGADSHRGQHESRAGSFFWDCPVLACSVAGICYGASLFSVSAVTAMSLEAEEDRFIGLVQNSPFGMETAVPAAKPMLEFRGYVNEKKRFLFSLACPDANGRIRSAWVGLDEPYAEFVVRSFDRDTDTVQVEHRGQKFALTLKLSRVQLLHAPERSPIGVEPAVVVNEKAQREIVAAEIRRRWAQRQANAESFNSEQP